MSTFVYFEPFILPYDAPDLSYFEPSICTWLRLLACPLRPYDI